MRTSLLRLPDLGGLFTILNLLTWAIALSLVHYERIHHTHLHGVDIVLEVWLSIGSMPLIYFWQTGIHSPLAGSGDDFTMAKIAAATIGLNAFIWGYGMAAILRFFNWLLKRQTADAT